MSQKRHVRPTASTPKVAPQATEPIVHALVQVPILNTDMATDNRLRPWFMGISAVVLVLMLWMSLGTGINGDDSFQNAYCDRLLNWYGTMGKDTSALEDNVGYMHLYGGFFEIVTGVTNKGLGLTADDPAYHDVRHVWNALFGFLAMLFTALLARLIAGWRGAILTMLFMFLSPRFLGDSLMNPKDIPFAAGNAMALYFMVRFYREMPKPTWQTLLGVAGGIAMALAARAGALLLIAYLGLFALIHIWLTYRTLFNIPVLMKYVKFGAMAAVGGFVLGILFWPYALVNPIANPIEALSAFTKYGVKIRLLYKGDNIMSDTVDWQYPIQWILRTIPPFAIVGFGLCLALIRSLMRRYDPVAVGLVVFATIFPVAYIIYQDSVLHDGWRHLTFVYPSMVIMAVLAFMQLEAWLGTTATKKYIILGFVTLLAAQPAAFIAMNPHYAYVYFSPLFGGIKANYGNFETDYWGVSVRQGVEWLEKEGKISPDMKDTVVIGTNFVYNVDRYVKKKYQGKVKLAYVKYANRYDYAWNYGLFVSRFVPGAQLRAGGWPEKGAAIHTIDANGTPILAILQTKNTAIFGGIQAAKKQDWLNAIDSLNVALKSSADNEIALQALSNAYLQTNQLDQAKAVADKVAAINPEDAQAQIISGLVLFQKGDLTNAGYAFEAITKKTTDNPMAYFWLAQVQKVQQNNIGAMENIIKCLQLNGSFRPAIQLGLEVSTAMGDQQRAAQFQQMLQNAK